MGQVSRALPQTVIRTEEIRSLATHKQDIQELAKNDRRKLEDPSDIETIRLGLNIGTIYFKHDHDPNSLLTVASSRNKTHIQIIYRTDASRSELSFKNPETDISSIEKLVMHLSPKYKLKIEEGSLYLILKIRAPLPSYTVRSLNDTEVVIQEQGSLPKTLSYDEISKLGQDAEEDALLVAIRNSLRNGG